MKLTPKGMRDIDAEQMLVRERAIDSIRAIFRKYGYRPLETPAMEYLDTLRAKAGEEVDKQIFVIEGDEYGLRFDLTVPLARYGPTRSAPSPTRDMQLKGYGARKSRKEGASGSSSRPMSIS